VREQISLGASHTCVGLIHSGSIKMIEDQFSSPQFLHANEQKTFNNQADRAAGSETDLDNSALDQEPSNPVYRCRRKNPLLRPGSGPRGITSENRQGEVMRTTILFDEAIAFADPQDKKDRQKLRSLCRPQSVNYATTSWKINSTISRWRQARLRG
jgi:hypothetical protein